MLMVTSTRESGSMIKHKVEVHMSILTAPNTSETGKKIDSTDMVLRPGQIMPDMKVTMNSGRSTELEPSSGQMDLLILENSTIITSTAKVCTPGLTIENTRANGEPTRCMAKALSLGLTEESMSVSTLKTKRKATANLSGQMVDATEENGSTESSMEKDLLFPAQAKRNTVNGKTAKELDG